MAVLIRGGTIVNADTSQRADVLVKGETIAAVGVNHQTASSRKI